MSTRENIRLIARSSLVNSYMAAPVSPPTCRWKTLPALALPALALPALAEMEIVL